MTKQFYRAHWSFRTRKTCCVMETSAIACLCK